MLMRNKPDIIVAFDLMDSSKTSRLKEVGLTVPFYKILNQVQDDIPFSLKHKKAPRREP